MSKRRALDAVAREWLRTTRLAFKWYWAESWRTGSFNPRLRCSGPTSLFPATRLVNSQKDLMLRALAGQAQGWVSNLANRARKLLRSLADPVLRHEVMWVNACHLWKASNAAQNAALRPGKGPDSISHAATRLARRWFNNYVKLFKLPDTTGLPLQFNVLSAKIERARESSHWYSDTGPRYRRSSAASASECR